MELDEILKLIEEKGIEYIRYIYVDNDGVIRGKMGNARNAKSDLVSGVTYVACMQSAFGALDLLTPDSIYGCVGELKHIPDLDTFRILPYAEKCAMVIGDFYTKDMKIFEADPRPILKEKLKELDFDVVATFETEFYFFDSRELEKDKVFEEFWGKTLCEEYIRTKKFEWSMFCQHVTDWEIQKYLKAF